MSSSTDSPETAEETRGVLSGSGEPLGKLTGRVRAVDFLRKLNVSGALLCALPAGVGLAFLLFSLTDIAWKLGVPSRTAFWTAAFGGALAVAGVVAAKFLWRKHSEIEDAVHLEKTYPALESTVSTAIEFGSDKEKTRKRSSPALVGELVRVAETVSKDAPPAGAVKWRIALISFAAFAAVIAGVLAYRFASPRLFSATWQRFFKPLSHLPPPTLTLIDRSSLGDAVLPRDAEFTVSAGILENDPGAVEIEFARMENDSASGSRNPEAAGEPKIDSARTETVVESMEPARDADEYRFTFYRLREDFRFRVMAGDDSTRWYTVRVLAAPEVDVFQITLEYPPFTGMEPETLVERRGSFSALVGTRARIHGKYAGSVSRGELAFQSGEKVALNLSRDGEFEASFAVRRDDLYSIHLYMPEAVRPGMRNGITAGPDNPSPALYRVRALKNLPPKVKITSPGKDQMVFKDGTLKTGDKLRLKIHATDDWHLNRLGVRWTLGRDMQEKTLRYDPKVHTTEMDYDGEFPLKFAKVATGAIITYYAFAEDVMDTDATGGPITRETRSDIHFLMTYDIDEYDRYEKKSKKQRQGEQDFIQPLEKLIAAQKKLLRKTFAEAARVMRKKQNTRGTGAAVAAKQNESRYTGPKGKLTEQQRDIRTRTEQLLSDLNAIIAGGDPFGRREKDAYRPGEEEEQGPLFGAKEMKLLGDAAGKMGDAAGSLGTGTADGAIAPEAEAVRLLSEARRVVMTQGAGGAMANAMRQAGKRGRNRQKRNRNKTQEEIRKTLADMPEMLETLRTLEDELARLERERKHLENSSSSPQQKERNRRKLRDKLASASSRTQEIRDKVEEKQRKVRRLADKEPDMPETAPRNFDRAAENLQAAAEKLDKGKPKEAAEKLHQARRNVEQARAGLARNLEARQDEQLKEAYHQVQQLLEDQRKINESTRQTAEQKQQIAGHLAEVRRQRAQLERGAPRQSEAERNQNQPNANTADSKRGEQGKQGEPEQTNESSSKTSSAANTGEPRQAASTSEQAGNESAAAALRELQKQLEEQAGKAEAQARALSARQGEIGERLGDLNDELKHLAETDWNGNETVREAVAEMERRTRNGADAVVASREAAEALQRAESEKADVQQQRVMRALENVRHNATDALAARERGIQQKLAKAAERLAQLKRAASKSTGNQQREQARQSSGGQSGGEQLAEQLRRAAEELGRQFPESEASTRDRAREELERAADELEKAAGEPDKSRAREAGRRAAGAVARARAEVNRTRLERVRELLDEIRKAGDQAAKAERTAAKNLRNQPAGEPGRQRQSGQPESSGEENRDKTRDNQSDHPRAAREEARAAEAERAAHRAADMTADMREGLRRLRGIFEELEMPADARARKLDEEFSRRRIESRARALARALAEASREARATPDSRNELNPRQNAQRPEATRLSEKTGAESQPTAGKDSAEAAPDESAKNNRRPSSASSDQHGKARNNTRLSRDAGDIADDLDALNRQLGAFEAELQADKIKKLRQALTQSEKLAAELDDLAKNQPETTGNPQSGERSADGPDAETMQRLSEKLGDIQREVADLAKRFAPKTATGDGEPDVSKKAPNQKETRPDTDKGRESKDPLADASELFRSAATRLADARRSLSDPVQPERPSRADIFGIRDGVQRGGDSLGTELEAILKSLEFDAAVTEQVPPDYETAVARYFQSLSEDK